MGAIIEVACHKGGAGKTTTVQSLAGYFASLNLRVLIVDGDEQANQKTLFGIRLAESSGDLADIFDRNLSADKVVQKTQYENIDVIISGGRKIKTWEEENYDNPDKYQYYKKHILPLKDLYDIILLDTPPALGTMMVNAAVIADYVLAVAEPDIMSALGAKASLQYIHETIGMTLKVETPEVLGLLVTRFDGRRGNDHDCVEQMEQTAESGGLYGGIVFKPIRADAKVRTAQSRRKTIFDFAPASNAALDYKKVGDHILNKIEACKLAQQTVSEAVL